MIETSISKDMKMDDILKTFPGARRALFQGFHIGGCQSCGFSGEETLEEVANKHGHSAEQIARHLEERNEREKEFLILPAELREQLDKEEPINLIDLRGKEAFDQDHIEGAKPISEEFADEVMNWPKDTLIVVYCDDGVGSMNAVDYLVNAGFTRVRCVAGGLDAWKKSN